MILEFEGIKNIRELGGMVGSGGRRIKQNKLFRSGHLAAATDADIARLESYSVCGIFDLRYSHECEREPDRTLNNAEYLQFSALPAHGGMEKGDIEEYVRSNSAELFKTVYAALAVSKESAAAYRAFFKMLLSCRDGAVLWHCTQGKDRTGIVSLLLLAVLGVSEKDAIDEYMLSNEVMGDELAAMKKRLRADEYQTMQKLLLVERGSAESFITAQKQKYGSLLAYLKSVEIVTDEEITALQDAYLE